MGGSISLLKEKSRGVRCEKFGDSKQQYPVVQVLNRGCTKTETYPLVPVPCTVLQQGSSLIYSIIHQSCVYIYSFSIINACRSP
jgi:hypothetical protein